MALSPLEKTILSNQMDVIRYGDATAKELIYILGEAQTETIAVLQGIGGADLPLTRLHAQLTLQQTSGTLSILSEKYQDIITDAQAAVIANEYESVTAALTKEAAAARVVPDIVPKLPIARIAALVEQPVGGKPLGAWISNNLGHLEKDIKRSLGTAIARGEGTIQAADRLRQSFGLSRRGATVIARTSLLSAAHAAREELYDRVDSLIKSYTYLATLDSRTCPVCGPWDGVTKATRTELPSVPQHPQCRCIHRPNTRFADYDTLKRPAVTETDAKVTHHKDGSTSTTFKPASVKHISGGTTYQEFFASQPEAWQRAVLGKTRFELLKAGKIQLKDLTSATDGRLLTIKALKAKIARGSLVESWPPTATFKDAVTLAIKKQALVSYTPAELAALEIEELRKIARYTGAIPHAKNWPKADLIEALTTNDLRRYNQLLKIQGEKASAKTLAQQATEKAKKAALAAEEAAKKAGIVTPHISPEEVSAAGFDASDHWGFVDYLGGVPKTIAAAQGLGLTNAQALLIDDVVEFLKTTKKGTREALVAQADELAELAAKQAAEAAAAAAKLAREAEIAEIKKATQELAENIAEVSYAEGIYPSILADVEEAAEQIVKQTVEKITKSAGAKLAEKVSKELDVIVAPLDTVQAAQTAKAAGQAAAVVTLENAITANLPQTIDVAKKAAGKALLKSAKEVAEKATLTETADLVEDLLSKGAAKEAIIEAVKAKAPDFAKIAVTLDLSELKKSTIAALETAIQDKTKATLSLVTSLVEDKAINVAKIATHQLVDTLSDYVAPLLDNAGLQVLAKAKGIGLQKAFFELVDTAKVPKKLVQVASKPTLMKLASTTSKNELQALLAELEELDKAKTAKISAKLKANAAAKKAQKEAGKAPMPAPAPNTVAVVEDSIPAVEPAPSFAAVDEAWEEIAKNPAAYFKLEGVARVSGAHGNKYFYTDPAGQRWLFKGQSSGWKDYVTEGEEAAYKIKRLLFPDLTPEVRVINLPGRGRGTIQPWREGLGPELRGVDVTTLSARELQQLQEEHVVDWLIGNHDSHKGQFHRMADGRLLGIDKGQAFKFYGKDKLSPTYNPNHPHEIPIYEDIAKALSKGQLKVDPQVTLRAIEKLERIPDEQLLASVSKYAEGWEGPGGRAAFEKLVLDRKKNLRRDFEAWYEEVLGVKGFKFSPPANAAVPARAVPQVTRQIDEAVAQRVARAKARGLTIQVDAEDIEDLTVLIGEELDPNGQPVTTLTLKLTPGVSDIVKKALIGSAGAPGAAAEFVDPVFSQMVSHIRSIAARIKKGDVIKPETLSYLKQAQAHLISLSNSKDEVERALAKHYLPWLEDMQKTVNNPSGGVAWGQKLLEKFVPPPPKPVAPTGALPRIKSSRWREFTWRNGSPGQLKEQAGERTLTQAIPDFYDTTPVQIVAETTSGAEVTFVPWKTVANETPIYALQGRATVRIPGAVTPARINEALEEIRALGVKTDLADPDYVEFLYLWRHAYQKNIDRKAPYLEIAKMANGKARNDALAAQLKKDLKIDLRASPDYNPQGVHAKGILPGDDAAGHRLYYRADFTDAEAVDVLDGGYVYHESTSKPLDELVDILAKGNQGLASNSHKVWLHIDPRGGMSPKRDMETGGASFVFARLRRFGQYTNEAGLYFHPRTMRRLDASWVNGDNFGRSYGDERRGYMSHDLRKIKKTSLSSNNEIIFKDVLPLDQLEYVVAGDTSERARIIEAFRKNGITHLANGRKVEDAVILRGIQKSTVSPS